MKRKPLLVLASIIGAGAIVACGPKITSESSVEELTSDTTSETAITSEKESSKEETSVTSEAPVTSEIVSSSEQKPSSSEQKSSSSEGKSSSSNVESSSSSSVAPVVKTVQARVVDEHNLFVGNPTMSVDGGEYEEVLKGSDGYYTFVIGAQIRMAMADNGFFIASGATINGTNYKINAKGNINFVAEENMSATSGDTTMEIVATWEDTTPTEKEYKIQVDNSSHIALHVYNDTKKVEIDTCDMDDIVYVKAEATDGYIVKQLSGYTLTDVTSGAKRTIEFKYIESEDLYQFKCPFSSDKLVRLSVTEIDGSAFADSDLLGKYAVIRTYNFNGTGTYANSISDFSIDIDASGKFDYSSSRSGVTSTILYLQEETDGVIKALNGTSTVDMYKGNNILVYGNNATTIATAFQNGANDITVAFKIKDGTKAEDYTLVNEIFTIGSISYGSFNIYLGETLHASCYITNDGNKIITDTNVVMHNGANIQDNNAVYDVYKGEDKLVSVGYVDGGGKGNRSIITSFANKYTNDEHTLLFTSNETALFDEDEYKVTVETDSLKLTSPSRIVVIQLKADMKFVVVSNEEIVRNSLDIAGKVFEGSYSDDGSPVKAQIIFGDSNDNITGKIVGMDYFKYYWDFTATFDEKTNTLNAILVERGYWGKPANTAPEIGKQFVMYLEDGKITFKDHWVGNNAYNFKGSVFTCADFKL